MRYSELERELRKAGCYIVRSGASHDIWFSPITGKKFTVPRHGGKEVPIGTYESIMKAAGLK